MQWLALFLSTISRYFVCLSADAQTPFTHTLLPKKYHWRRRKKLWKSTASRIYSVWKLLETQTDKLIILHIFESTFMHWQRPTTECCCYIPLSLSRLLTTVQHPRRLAPSPAALLLTTFTKFLSKSESCLRKSAIWWCLLLRTTRTTGSMRRTTSRPEPGRVLAGLDKAELHFLSQSAVR